MVVKVAKIADLCFPLDLNYSYHKRGHTWVKQQPDENVLIGLDHFAAIPLIMTARPLPFVVDLPPVRTELSQDEPYGFMESAKYAGTFIAPISGVIVKVNEERCAHPPHYIKNPYTDGWMLVLKPLKFEEEKKNLLTGEAAIEWIRKDIIEYSTDKTHVAEAKKGAIIVELESLDEIVKKSV